LPDFSMSLNPVQNRASLHSGFQNFVEIFCGWVV